METVTRYRHRRPRLELHAPREVGGLHCGVQGTHFLLTDATLPEAPAEGKQINQREVGKKLFPAP